MIKARRQLGFSVTILITDRPEIESAYIGDKCRTRAFLILPIIAHYNLACWFPGYCYIFFFPLPPFLGARGNKKKNISLLRKYIQLVGVGRTLTVPAKKTIDLRSVPAMSENSTIENRLKEISFFSDRSKI